MENLDKNMGGNGGSKFCQYCDQELARGYRFCRYCGNNLQNIQQNPIRGENVCSSCGNRIIPGSTFCTACGSRVGSGYQQQNFNDMPSQNIVNRNFSPPSPPPPKKLCDNCGTPLDTGKNYCTFCGKMVNGVDSNGISYSQQAVNRDIKNQNVSTRNMSNGGYSPSYFLIGLFLLTILLALWGSLGITILLVIISAIAVYSDAKGIIINKPRGEETLSTITWSPISWGLLTLLIWIIGMPLYILKRKELFDYYSSESDNFSDYGIYNNQRKGGSCGGVILSIIKILLLLGVVIIFSLIIAVFVFGLSEGTSNYPTSSSNSDYSSLSIGETAYSNYESATVLGVEVSDSYTYYSDIFNEYMVENAQPGYEYVLVDVLVENLGSDSIYVTASDFNLEDSEHYSYDPEVLYYGNDGFDFLKELYNGQKNRGKLLFIVPEGTTGMILNYDLGNIFSGSKIAGWLIGSESSRQKITSSTSIHTAAPTVQTTTSSSSYHKMGESVSNGETTVVIHSFEIGESYTYYSDIFNEYMVETVEPGFEFILVDVSIENIDSDDQYISSSYFMVEDSEHYSYDPEVLYYGTDAFDLFAELSPNQKRRGIVLFKVPADSNGLTLYYNFGNIYTGSDLEAWIIN